MQRQYTQDILQRAAGVPITIVDDHTNPIVNLPPYPQSLNQGKQHLHLCVNRGRFFKPCPGTKEYRCCDYQVLNIGMNCPMDCVYCILQAYMNNPWLSYFVNVEDLLTELDTAFAAQPGQFFRIGTGEFTDSLALDRLTGLSKILVNYMSGKERAVLELKTKSVMIDNLADLEHNGRTVISWSLNSQAIMTREEIRTAPLEERLNAAAQCADWGYKLAFHFDPIIYHAGWQDEYSATIDRLFAKVPAENIVWISLGALRFLPSLKEIAVRRFPGSRFFHEEFIIGLDGKYRYFRTLRVELYRHLYQLLKKYVGNKTCVYLCMESDEVWRDAGIPGNPALLPAMLDNAVSC